MEEEQSKFIEKIVLEIDDRSLFWFYPWRDWKKKKLNCRGFNPREAAYAFLRQYNQENFVRGQKINVWYDNQDLHLHVREMFYGNINPVINTTVEFLYRKGMFSEIRWPVMNVNRISRVRWANEVMEPIPEIQLMNDPPMKGDGFQDDDPFSEDYRLNSGFEKSSHHVDGNLTLGHDIRPGTHFRSSIFIQIDRNDPS